MYDAVKRPEAPCYKCFLKQGKDRDEARQRAEEDYIIQKANNFQETRAFVKAQRREEGRQQIREGFLGPYLEGKSLREQNLKKGSKADDESSKLAKRQNLQEQKQDTREPRLKDSTSSRREEQDLPLRFKIEKDQEDSSRHKNSQSSEEDRHKTRSMEHSPSRRKEQSSKGGKIEERRGRRDNKPSQRGGEGIRVKAFVISHPFFPGATVSVEEICYQLSIEA